MRIFCIVNLLLLLGLGAAWAILPVESQEVHGSGGREALDRLRDRDLQPGKILEVIKLRPGMTVGEAGASYGYFTFKLSEKAGDAGRVYANDIDPEALKEIEAACAAKGVTNITTVLGAVDDPLFPVAALDMLVVFDCLFEFSKPVEWMRNARKYLKPGGTLVIVDPDPSKLGSGGHFLSRKTILEFAREAGYAIGAADDSFLKSHMIIVLRVD